MEICTHKNFLICSATVHAHHLIVVVQLGDHVEAIIIQQPVLDEHLTAMTVANGFLIVNN